MSSQGVLYITCILFLILTLSSSQTVQLKSWKFQLQSDQKIYPAQIPSTLAQDLIKVNLISNNPYYRDNFLQYYKYQTRNVNYSTTFTAPAESRGNVISELIFQGLDTHCDIFLNNKKIYTAHNMFRRYVIPITNLTQNNSLIVAFYSSALYDIKKQKQFNEEYDFNLPANYSFTRKAAYQYGWDWGPRILTVGIWKQAYVQFGLPTRIQNLRINNLLHPITQKLPKIIRFNVQGRLENLHPSSSYYCNLLVSRYNETYTYQTQIKPQAFSYNFSSTTIVLQTGRNVKNASSYLWWTWDLGQPNCINLTLTIKQTKSPHRQWTKKVLSGLRTVKVRQQLDSMGKQFTLTLNGIDIFIRGGNYIPPEMSMSKIPGQTYKKIKQYALFGKFNMLRVWGGGQFEHQQFYKTIDEAGILIWHDLMFACAMYPVTAAGDQLQNIRKQMQDNLYRIGHHPSIALWNGNNEVWIGWQQWGWKRNLTNLQILQAQSMYKKIFHQLLPQVINRITPDIFYWQTSPSSSSNQLSTIKSGDIHFWRVWGGGTQIEEYQQYIGRFNSQYGMQSMSDYSTILKYTNAGDRVIDSFILRLHQRHIFGDKYLPKYTQKYATLSTNLKRYAYYTQVMQSYALEMAIVSLRGNKPYCMGSIYWQLNDVWPVNSWATVDYYGMYKAAHYRIRQLHNQLLVHVLHIAKNNVSQEIYKAIAVNQYDKKISLFVMIKIIDFNGTVYNSFQIQKTASPFENIVLNRINVTGIPKNRSLINVIARDTQNNIYQNNYYFVPPANRVILKPNLNIRNLGGNKISVKTDNLVNYLWIIPVKQTQGYNYENNYVDILPGQEVIVNLPYDLSNVKISCYQIQRLLEMEEGPNKNLKKQTQIQKQSSNKRMTVQ